MDRSAYLSSYFTDELLRRRINTQLNRQESRHNLARKIFHGQKGRPLWCSPRWPASPAAATRTADGRGDHAAARARIERRIAIA